MNEYDTAIQRPKILPPKVDVVFKLLFGDERNTDILIDFLKSVLSLSEDEYDKITITDTHLKRETIDDKLGVVDVKLTTKNGTIIHIEIQVAKETAFPERITYYNAKMLVTQLKSSEEYLELDKVITIAIADFEIFKQNNMYHHIFQLQEKSTGLKLTDRVEIHTLELEKIPKETDNTAKYDWLQFLRTESEEEFEMLSERNPAIKKAVVELKRLSQDEEAQMLYEARQKAAMDEKSRMRGMQREIATNFLKMGISVEQTAEGTGLPVTIVEKLKNNID